MPVDRDRLQKIDLFAELPDEALDQLSAAAQEASMPEGTELVRKGTWAYQLFALEEGSVDVVRGGDTLAQLQAGDVVGETGSVNRALRNATAVATEPLRVIYFIQADVDRLRREIPDLDERLQALLEERGG